MVSSAGIDSRRVHGTTAIEVDALFWMTVCINSVKINTAETANVIKTGLKISDKMLDIPIPRSSSDFVRLSKNGSLAFPPTDLKQNNKIKIGLKAIKIHKYTILRNAKIQRRIIVIAYNPIPAPLMRILPMRAVGCLVKSGTGTEKESKILIPKKIKGPAKLFALGIKISIAFAVF